jgi:hypothetical protein
VKAWAAGGEKPSGDLPRSLIARRQNHDKTVEEIGAAKMPGRYVAFEVKERKDLGGKRPPDPEHPKVGPCTEIWNQPPLQRVQ